MSAKIHVAPRPLHQTTLATATALSGADGTHPRRSAESAVATALHAALASSDKWTQWAQHEPRLDGFASFDEVRAAWRRRDERCYQVVAGLASLGSRRGGDDDDAALAVVVLLEDGVKRVAMTLADLCEVDDVNATVWEEVKSAEPQLGRHAARYLLQRTRQRLSRPAAGMVSRVDTTSLEAAMSSAHSQNEDRDLRIAVPQVEDPVEDLADLFSWATGVGVIGPEDVDLLVELMAAENEGLGREEAQRVVGERRGVGMRTIRRRTTRVAELLSEAAPRYLAEIA